MTPAPLPHSRKKKKKNQSRIPLWERVKVKSCLARDQVWVFKLHPKPLESTLLPVCTVSLLSPFTLFWRVVESPPLGSTFRWL